MEHTTTQPVTAEKNTQPKQAWATPRLRTEGTVATATFGISSGAD